MSNTIRSRGLSYDELVQLVDWIAARKDRLYSIKYLTNRQYTLKRLHARIEELGIQHITGYYLTIDVDLNPNLAMEFKLAWT
jgi:arginase family enzyme